MLLIVMCYFIMLDSIFTIQALLDFFTYNKRDIISLRRRSHISIHNFN